MSDETPTAAELLAEETGDPIEKFTPSEDAEHPHPTEVERVEVSE